MGSSRESQRIDVRVAWSLIRRAVLDIRTSRRQFVAVVQELLDAGWKQSQIARELDISRQRLNDMLQSWKDGEPEWPL